MGRVFLVGVGWIWARSAGKEKNCTIPALYPRAFSFFIQKRCHFSFSGYGIGHVYSPFSMGSDFFRQSYKHHMDDISSQRLSLLVVLSGNAHIVANSPIFFWDVIGSEWVIAIEF